MPGTFIVLCSLLASASAGVTLSYPAADAVASTQQQVVRSFDGTVSAYAKAVDTPYSSVRKDDVRISNNVYTPGVASAVTYAAPAVTGHFVPAVYQHSTPVVAKAHIAPVDSVVRVYSQHTPTVLKHAATPVFTRTLYTPSTAAVHSLPAVYSHVAAPATATIERRLSYTAPAIAKAVAYPAYNTYNQAPAAVYANDIPSYHAQSIPVHYSPAQVVSHVSFDGFGTHWGY